VLRKSGDEAAVAASRIAVLEEDLARVRSELDGGLRVAREEAADAVRRRATAEKDAQRDREQQFEQREIAAAATDRAAHAELRLRAARAELDELQTASAQMRADSQAAEAEVRRQAAETESLRTLLAAARQESSQLASGKAAAENEAALNAARVTALKSQPPPPSPERLDRQAELREADLRASLRHRDAQCDFWRANAEQTAVALSASRAEVAKEADLRLHAVSQADDARLQLQIERETTHQLRRGVSPRSPRGTSPRRQHSPLRP